ncbi:sulfite exporter TauE/SafE family protein, partial [Pseudomonas sp. MWU12-2115]
MIELIEYLLLGVVMGGVGGVFGIGGGMIAIPVLGILFGLDQQLAQGTAL